jgi:hypothetical protein
VASRPWILLAFVVVLTIAGAAYQRGTAWGRGGPLRARRDAPPLQGP